MGANEKHDAAYHGAPTQGFRDQGWGDRPVSAEALRAQRAQQEAYSQGYHSRANAGGSWATVLMIAGLCGLAGFAAGALVF